jgi:hypothetical protein
MVKIPIPAPPELEEALGYEGEARLVAFRWSPVGDEADFDDGRNSGTGNWDGFLALVDHPAVRPHLGDFRHRLGSSDEEATHWLLLDREDRTLQVLVARDAGRLLREQWQDGKVSLASGPLAAKAIPDLLDLSKWQEVQIDDAEIERRMRRREKVLRAVVVHLDRYIN